MTYTRIRTAKLGRVLTPRGVEVGRCRGVEVGCRGGVEVGFHGIEVG